MKTAAFTFIISSPDLKAADERLAKVQEDLDEAREQLNGLPKSDIESDAQLYLESGDTQVLAVSPQVVAECKRRCEVLAAARARAESERATAFKAAVRELSAQAKPHHVQLVRETIHAMERFHTAHQAMMDFYVEMRRVGKGDAGGLHELALQPHVINHMRGGLETFKNATAGYLESTK